MKQFTMKLKKIAPLIVIFIALVISTFSISRLSWSGVSNTKHNLSVTGPGTIKAVSETEICVFCHTPHNASPSVPLWNHTMSGAAYTLYDSEYLKRVDTGGYEAIVDVGTRSKLCLSCHDGTVAIGSVGNLRGSSATITMNGTSAGKMPVSAVGYIGTNLRDDHPVAIVYDKDRTITFGSGQRTMELNAVIPSIVGINPKPYTPVRLYPGPTVGYGYVECTSCHDPHTEVQKFLVLWQANLATSINTICGYCHVKDLWSGSIHKTSLTVINNPVGDTQPIPGSNVSEAACMGCHKTHSGAGIPYLLRKTEENTCFNGTSTSCHGSSGAKNIQSVISRTYKHPATTTSGIHTNLDVLFPLGGTPAGSKGLDWTNSRHAECVDCHNTHQAAQGSHTPANQWYPSTVSAATNDVSNALTGVTGVQPGAQPLWTVITSYTTQKAAAKEYQICYKCHSYYALQDLDGVTVYTTASSATVTDQAREFSPGNKSAHPVEVTLNNMLTGSGGTSTPGSYTPKPLVTAQMSSPWNVSGTVGNQTMYCSDCHGADSESTTDPKGPHGSNSKYMLKGSRKYWPLNSSGGLWTLADIQNNTNNWSTNLFCVNCHPIYSGSTWQNNVHGRNNHISTSVYCISCHMVVPHGSKRSRLIGYASDTPPYNYNGTGNQKLIVSGFKKAAGPNSYAKANCYSTVTGCTTHSNSGGYDP